MARYYKIKISGTVGVTPTTIWLTSDGTEAGRACKTKIPGADLLLAPITATGTIGNAGNPFNEKPLTDGGGRDFDVQVSWMPTAVFEDLKELIDAMQAADSEANVTGEDGEPGEFDVDAVYRADPIPLSFDGFSIGFVKNVVIRFRTTAIN